MVEIKSILAANGILLLVAQRQPLLCLIIKRLTQSVWAEAGTEPGKTKIPMVLVFYIAENEYIFDNHGVEWIMYF